MIMVENEAVAEEESQSIFADKLHIMCCVDRDVGMCGIILRGKIEKNDSEDAQCKACAATLDNSTYCPRFETCLNAEE